MEEGNWPKPNFKSNIGKAPRVPKFGTWQAELEAEVDLPFLTDADEKHSGVQGRPPKAASSHSGRMRKIGARLLPSSAQSSSEDVSLLISARSGSAPRSRQRFTKDFEQARIQKLGPTRDLETAATGAEEGTSQESEDELPELNDLNDELWGDDMLHTGSAARQGSALFRSPSEPPVYWNAPPKKEAPRGALNSAVRTLGASLKDTGRTASTGTKNRRHAAKPPRQKRSVTPVQQEAEIDFPKPKRAMTTPERGPEKGAGSGRATPVFGEWAEAVSRPLSPLLSYSVVFDDVRQGRKKATATEVLERLKASYATKEYETSSADGCGSEAASLASTLEVMKTENSTDSSPDSTETSEAAWLRRRMLLKAAVDQQDSPVGKYSDSATSQQAAKERKGAMQRSSSEVVPPSTPRQLQNEGATDTSCTNSSDLADNDTHSPYANSASNNTEKDEESKKSKKASEGPGPKAPEELSTKVMCKSSSTSSACDSKAAGASKHTDRNKTSSGKQRKHPPRPGTAPPNAAGKPDKVKQKKGRKISSHQQSPACPQSECRTRPSCTSQSSMDSPTIISQCSHSFRLGFRAFFTRGQRPDASPSGSRSFPKTCHHEK